MTADTREELDLHQARTMGEDAVARSRMALERVTQPHFPGTLGVRIETEDW